MINESILSGAAAMGISDERGAAVLNPLTLPLLVNDLCINENLFEGNENKTNQINGLANNVFTKYVLFVCEMLNRNRSDLNEDPIPYLKQKIR